MKNLSLSLILVATLMAAGCNVATNTNDYNSNQNINSDTAQEYEQNVVLVTFAPGTKPERMQQIAAAVGGTIEPYQEGKTAYKISLNTQTQDQASVPTAISKIKTYSE